MSDQVDPITPPIADPQAAVDAALEPAPPAVTPVTPPVITLVDPPVVPSSPSSVPMSDETPLAFVTPEPITSVNEPAIIPPDTTIPPATIPPVPEFVAPIPKKKSKILLVVVGIMALLGALGVGGYYAYTQFGGGEGITIAGVTIGRNGRPREITDPGNCEGESNGGWLVWRNGECKVTGISGTGEEYGTPEKDTVNPNTQNADTSTECSNAGGSWCTGTDTRGQTYNICAPAGTNKACYQHAIDAGYTMNIGTFNGSCEQVGGVWQLTGDSAASYAPYDNETYRDKATGKTPKDKANDLCKAGNGTLNFGTAKYICKEGVKGEGDVVYSGGACTELNGKKFVGNELGCFCGVIQVDQGAGHTSYSSKCGCDKKSDETTVTSTTTTTPTMACTGLTRTPTTTPTVGQAVTFTCVGSVTPSTAGTLSYKYRYSLNSGAYLPMTSNVLTIAACGSYSVQCQACATLNGVLTCDPTWTGATP